MVTDIHREQLLYPPGMHHLPQNLSRVCSLFIQRGVMIQHTVTGTRRYSADLQGGLAFSRHHLLLHKVHSFSLARNTFRIYSTLWVHQTQPALSSHITREFLEQQLWPPLHQHPEFSTTLESTFVPRRAGLPRIL